MHPTVATFLRLTAIIALALIGIFIAVEVFKLVLLAAFIAALAVGVLFLYNVIRRRASLPLIRR
jgi:hypothetical protein